MILFLFYVIVWGKEFWVGFLVLRVEIFFSFFGMFNIYFLFFGLKKVFVVFILMFVF